MGFWTAKKKKKTKKSTKKKKKDNNKQSLRDFRFGGAGACNMQVAGALSRAADLAGRVRGGQLRDLRF